MTETAATIALSVIGPPRWSAVPDPRVEPGEPATLLTVSSAGDVTAYSGKVEYGQGIRNGFAMMVAQELGLPASAVTVVLGDTDRVPRDRGTTGSASTRTVGSQLRRAAATARDALVNLAAEQLGVDASDIQLSGGGAQLKSDRGRSATFDVLLRDKTLELHVPDDVAVSRTTADAGRSPHRADAFERVTGQAKFARDVSLPGMLHGKVLRPPSYRARLLDLDTSRAERVPGFVSVVREDGFAGLVAETEDAAAYAIDTVRARWQEERDAASDWNLPSLLKENAGEPFILQERGAPGAAFEHAHRIFEGIYFAPYVANAQMEPSAAVASWDGDRLTMWCSNRAPFNEQEQLAGALGISPENIHVITQAVGGSFGTKSATVSLEAAKLARAAHRPVRVTYTREEEFSWSTVRPASLSEIRSGVTSDGKIVAWDHRAYHAGENAFRGRRGADTPYNIENINVAVSGSTSPLLYGSYRSLGGAVNHFARESHMDVIARGLNIDPLEFRLKHLSHPRFIRVLRAATDRFSWAARAPRASTGFGLALGFDAGSYVAQCVELTVNGSEVKVDRVIAAIDCGEVINEDGVINQVEGSIIMGMGTALWESVEFDGGRVLSDGFAKYRVPRISDAPEIDVVVIDDPSNPPTGAGEPGIVPIAAAIANAVADATGKRIEQLPIGPQLR